MYKWFSLFGWLLFLLLNEGNAQDCENLLTNPQGNNPVTTGWTILQVSGNSPGFAQNPGTGFVSTYGGCGSLRWNRKAQTIDLLALGLDPAWLDSSPDLTVGESFLTVWTNAFCTYPSGNALDLYYLTVELRDASNAVIGSINWGSTGSPLFAPTAGITHSHTFSGYPSGLRYIYFEDGGMDAGYWGGFYGTHMDNPIVRFDDPIPPTITCPDDFAQGNDPDECSAVVSFMATAEDNCSATISYSPASGSEFSIGSTLVTATATDPAGNTASCTFIVTVNDTQGPSIDCPADLNVNVDQDQCSAIVCYDYPEASDNCVPATPTGYIAIGQFGNSFYYRATSLMNYATASAAARAAGGHLAIISSAAENAAIAAGMGGFGFSYIGGNDLESEGSWVWEDCSSAEYLNFNPGEPNGYIYENYLEFLSNGKWNDLPAGALRYSILEIENTPVVRTSGLAQGAAFPVGTTVLTFEALDGAGNVNSCSFEITVLDDQDPIISCPEDVEVESDPSACGAIVDYTLTYGDNCPDAELILQSGFHSGEEFPVGETTVTWVIVDPSNNDAECSFSVTVLDVEPPVVNCPFDVEVDNDPGECGAVVNYIVEVTDNCPGALLEQTEGLASGLQFPVGTTFNAFLLTDASGNSASCEFYVTVLDAESPVALCQDIMVDPEVNGEYLINASEVDAGSSDNCEILSITVDPSVIPCFHDATEQIVVLTVTDLTGNSSTCSATVTLGGDADCDGVGDACDQCSGGNDQIDNNNDGFPDCDKFPGLGNLDPSWKCGNKNDKVYVCHFPPGNPNNKSTLCLSANAVQAHLNHGCYVGPCDNASCNGGGEWIVGPGSIHTGLKAIEGDFAMFPNPAGSDVNIQILHVDEGGTIRICDALGHVVWTEAILPGQMETTIALDSDRFVGGVYTVRLEAGYLNLSKILVVTR